MLAAAAENGGIFAATGCKHFIFDDMFKMTDVMPRMTKIAEMRRIRS